METRWAIRREFTEPAQIVGDAQDCRIEAQAKVANGFEDTFSKAVTFADISFDSSFK